MIEIILFIYFVLILLAIILYLPRIVGMGYSLVKLRHRDAKEKRHIAILIPARNESAVIGSMFDSIDKQDYDKDFYEVFVIVKDENDPTIQMAKDRGYSVTVIKEQHCKGDALDGFFKSVEEGRLDKFEAFLIVDADGLLTYNFLTELNNGFEYDADIYVARKIAKNFLGGKNDRSIFSNCSALTYPMIDDLGNAYRTQKGMPLNMCGQGLIVRKRVIDELGGWPYRTMTEDYELKIDSLVRGFKSIYYPYCILYTEEAVTHKENYIRRVRWLTGVTQCNRKYKKAIVKQARERKYLKRGEREYFFGLMPYFLYAFATVVSALFGMALTIYYAVIGSKLWLTALLALFVMPLGVMYIILVLFSLIAMLISHDAFGGLSFKECFGVVMFNPIYMIEYFLIFFSSLKQVLKKEKVVWKETERVMKTE